MKIIQISHDEVMEYSIVDDPDCTDFKIEVTDEQAARWRRAQEDWAKAHAEITAAVRLAFNTRSLKG